MRRLQGIFDTVHESASRAAWSQGVELARGGAVFGESADAEEVIVRVRPSGGMIHPTVILYPDDEEWECDCSDPDDPCAHVAAAVIAVRKARREGHSLPAATEQAGGALHYRFTTTPTGLAFERFVVHAGHETPLRTTLTAARSGKADAPQVSPDQRDIAVERALGTRLYGPVPRGVVRALVRALDGCERLTLDGEPIRADREAVGMRAVLADEGAGFRLRVEPDAAVDRDLGDGFVLCGDVLRELAPTRLSGRERADLAGRGQHVPADAIAEVLSELIPGLEARMPVSIETERLPRSEKIAPRLVVETARGGDGALSVLAKLVYGDPAIARVDAGRLTLLAGAVPLRDVAAESALLARLRDATGLTPGRRERFSGEAAVHVASQLTGLGATVAGDAHEAFRLASPLAAELEMEGDGFRLRFSSSASGDEEPREATAEAVFRAWQSGESLVPLQVGGFATLPADWLDRYGPILRDLISARSPDGTVPTALLPDLARLAATLEAPAPPGFERLAVLLEGFEGLPEPELPTDLEAELRTYQSDGIRWLQFLGKAGLGGLLADDMGLGKTLQALCAITGRTLVVAPTSLLGGWQDEICRFRPALRAAVYHGSARRLDPDADVTLTTYAILRLDLGALREVRWDSLVLDEAQAIKNPGSQVAQAAYQLLAERRMTLTGTPVENRLDELWSQLHFLNPGLLGGRSDFDERYAKPIASGDDDTAALLRERIRPFVLRRRKREVAPELPPRTELILHCTLTEPERAVYDAVRAATQAEVLAQLETGGGVMAALEALLRMRQACCHPRLLPGQELDASAKLDLLVDRLETAASEGHRALVFSQWTSLLDLVEPRLTEASLGFVRLDGSTRDRSGVVARFQADDGPPVFLISLRAGGTGLNLTAADHVFLLDPWWNPAVEDQAADRAHRIGQDRPVVVHRMVAADTVEERILALQERKRALADAALEGGGAATTITRDELLELLGPAA